jgi:hypothetical protein
MVGIFPKREASLRLMTTLADLFLYPAWGASETTQMDYEETTFVCQVAIFCVTGDYFWGVYATILARMPILFWQAWKAASRG